MPGIRSFVAIELAAPVLEALDHLQSQLKHKVPAGAVRWTRVESIHLTLQFLGDVAPGQVGNITAALKAVAAEHTAFELELVGLGVFPNPRRPRIVWVGISEPSGALNHLQRAIGRVLTPLGYPPEERAFTPHLTIGRAARDASPAQLTQLGEVITHTQLGRLGRMLVDHLSLMKSDLEPGGAVYSAQAVLPLKR